jgi:hypothetical protein
MLQNEYHVLDQHKEVVENGLLSQTVVIFVSCLAKWDIVIDYN